MCSLRCVCPAVAADVGGVGVARYQPVRARRRDIVTCICLFSSPARMGAESPELAGLLQELQSTAGELKEKTFPVVAGARAGALPQSTELSFVEVKYQLLMSYISHILFYLLLKAEGKSVKDHPVMEELHRIRYVPPVVVPPATAPAPAPVRVTSWVCISQCGTAGVLVFAPVDTVGPSWSGSSPWMRSCSGKSTACCWLLQRRRRLLVVQHRQRGTQQMRPPWTRPRARARARASALVQTLTAMTVVVTAMTLVVTATVAQRPSARAQAPSGRQAHAARIRARCLKTC